jgi:hypothetical protein
MVITRGVSHYANTPSFEELRISVVPNKSWLLTGIGLRWGECIALLTT